VQKINLDLTEGRTYEASQLCMSYIARKKDTLGKKGISDLIFHIAGYFCTNNGHSDAGTIIQWYIEDGASRDHKFTFPNGEITAESPCDIKKLTDLLVSLKPVDAAGIVNKVCGPVHMTVLKETSKTGVSAPLASRMELLERNFAKIFEASLNWFNAYKCNLRLNNIERAANNLDSWSKEGYLSERPLFFGRAVLELLSTGAIEKAAELVKHSNAYINNEPAEGGGPSAAAYAVWHAALIASGLASMEPKPRVDKYRIFSILNERYRNILGNVDYRLVTLFDKVGESCFNVVRPESQHNPFSFLQSMLANTSSKGGAYSDFVPPKPGQGGLPAGLDMNMMLNMINSMQDTKPKK